MDDAVAIGRGHQGHKLGLQVGGEARIDLGRYIDRLQPHGRVTLHHHTVGRRHHLHPGLDHLVSQGRHQLRPGLCQPDLASGHGGGHGVGAHLDPVRDHRPARPAQRRNAGDGQNISVDPLDPGAHGGQAAGQIADLGLARSLPQHGHPVGQHGGQQGVFSRADRDERELDLGALQALRRAGDDIALLKFDLGPHGRQRLQVQIDRPGPDGAAAGQGHLGLAGAGQQRPQHIERGPHLADQIIRREGRGQGGGVEQRLLPVGAIALRDLDAEFLEQATEEFRIRQPRHVGQQQRLIGQDRSGHQLEGGVLGAADRNGSVQTGAAGDGDAVHVVSCDPEQGARGGSAI